MIRLKVDSTATPLVSLQHILLRKHAAVFGCRLAIETNYSNSGLNYRFDSIYYN